MFFRPLPLCLGLEDGKLWTLYPLGSSLLVCWLLSSRSGENVPGFEHAHARVTSLVLAHGSPAAEFAAWALSLVVCMLVPRICKFAFCAVACPSHGGRSGGWAITEELSFEHIGSQTKPFLCVLVSPLR